MAVEPLFGCLLSDACVQSVVVVVVVIVIAKIIMLIIIFITTTTTIITTTATATFIIMFIVVNLQVCSNTTAHVVVASHAELKIDVDWLHIHDDKVR